MVDAADVAAGQRGVEHLPIRGGGDAVGARTPGGVEDLDPADLWVEPSQHPRLPGEPQDVTAEGGRVEVGRSPLGRQRVTVDLLGAGVDPHDRVQAAVGDPRGPIRADDHAMRGRAVPERDQPALAGGRVQQAEVTGPLGGVPDRAAVGGRGDVVGSAPGRDRVLLHPQARRGRLGGRGRRRPRPLVGARLGGPLARGHQDRQHRQPGKPPCPPYRATRHGVMIATAVQRAGREERLPRCRHPSGWRRQPSAIHASRPELASRGFPGPGRRPTPTASAGPGVGAD